MKPVKKATKVVAPKSLEAKYGSPDKPLIINGIEIPCYVLANGKRVIVQRGLFKALGIIQGGSNNEKYKEFGGAARLAMFLDRYGIMSLPDSDLGVLLKEPIIFKYNNQDLYGYEATVLQEIVRAISKQYLKGKLEGRNEEIGRNAEMLDDAFAKIGIIAIIDEVTGYQDIRVKDALEKIFNEILLEKAKKYQVTFPIELYRQIFRLNGWQWKPESAQKKPGIIGKWTNDLIYARLAPNLLEELQRRNPKNEKGYREFKHFQFLTDEIGEPKLREFFGGLLALARVSTTWRKFYEMVERAYPKYGDQLSLDIPEEQ